MSQSRLPDRNLSRSAAEKVKGDVGVVCGARKPPRGRGGSGMRNRRDGVPGDQRGDRGDVGDWRDMLPGDQGDRGDCGAGLLVEVIFVEIKEGQVSLTYFSHCTSAG